MSKALLLVTLIAAAAVVLVVAQHPRHCAAPAEFEAHAFQLDHKEKFFRRGHFAYDSREERISLFEEIRNGTDDEAFHVITLHRERKQFRFNLKTKVCTTQDIHHRFHRIEIPRDAHFVGEAIIGTNAFENSGLITTHWEHHNKTEQTEWYGVYTDRDIGCVPVSDDFNDPAIGHVTTQYFDVVLGISDPNQFIPESSCKRTTSHRARKH
jgi:hypothetical protein